MSHYDLSILKKLCRIECSPEEEKALDRSLQQILGHVAKLEALDTQDVEPCRFVLREMLQSSLREDLVCETLPRETFLANAPDQIGGMVRTPPVL
jgi:aspartyl-tRNA(Asn)/glutamyl-tRNA(Gln) amidotransferase subunit C